MSGQRGAAIILAMLVVALAAAAASNFLFRAQLEWRKLENAAELNQARWVLRAAEQWAAAILLDDARNSSVDHRKEIWAQVLPPVDAEGYRVSGRIEDMDGRFNLNNLLEQGVVVPGELAILRRLLATLRLSPTLAPAIVDWLDADDQRLAAEDSERAAYHPARPPNRPLASIGELRGIPGVDAHAYAALAPFVTALPSRTRVNVNTARAEVIAALVDGLTLEDAHAVVARREHAWFRDLADFRAALPEWSAYDDARVAVRSEYFMVTAHASRQRLAIASRALLERKTMNFPTLVWRAAL